MKDWKVVLKTSHFQIDVIQWGVAFYVLAPVWLADMFFDAIPAFQEWIAFGFADEASRIRAMTPKEMREGLRVS
jgi:hypothetical protein